MHPTECEIVCLISHCKMSLIALLQMGLMSVMHELSLVRALHLCLKINHHFTVISLIVLVHSFRPMLELLVKLCTGAVSQHNFIEIHAHTLLLVLVLITQDDLLYDSCNLQLSLVNLHRTFHAYTLVTHVVTICLILNFKLCTLNAQES